MKARLHAGEVEAIMLARSTGAALVILDDNAAKKVAKHLGVPVTGTLGVLVRANHLGLLGEVAPVLDELAGVGFYVSDRVREIALARGDSSLCRTASIHLIDASAKINSYRGDIWLPALAAVMPQGRGWPPSVPLARPVFFGGIYVVVSYQGWSKPVANNGTVAYPPADSHRDRPKVGIRPYISRLSVPVSRR